MKEYSTPQDVQPCFLCGGKNFNTKLPNPGNYSDLYCCWNCQDKLHREIYVKVFKSMRIESAHCLYGHPKCGQVHGHSFKIVVGVQGRMNINTGMVMDFKDLKEIMKDEIGKFDHQFLNETLPIPTAEYFVLYLFDRVSRKLDPGVKLISIKIYETEDNYVEYDGSGFYNV